MKSQSIFKKILVLSVFVISVLFVNAQKMPVTYGAPPVPTKYVRKSVTAVPLDSDIVLPLIVATGAISLILKLKKKKKV